MYIWVLCCTEMVLGIKIMKNQWSNILDGNVHQWAWKQGTAFLLMHTSWLRCGDGLFRIIIVFFIRVFKSSQGPIKPNITHTHTHVFLQRSRCRCSSMLQNMKGVYDVTTCCWAGCREKEGGGRTVERAEGGCSAGSSRGDADGNTGQCWLRTDARE